MIRQKLHKIVIFARRIAVKNKYKDIGSNLKIKKGCNIEVRKLKCGNNVTFYEGVHLWGDGEIVIGDNSSIGEGTIIFAKDSVYIGNNCLIAGQCYIIDSDHGIDKSSLIRLQKMTSLPIFIGDDVWIAAGSKVLKGVQIGSGSVIGAMGVVNKNVEPNSINVGVPVRKIGERNI